MNSNTTNSKISPEKKKVTWTVVAIAVAVVVLLASGAAAYLYYNSQDSFSSRPSLPSEAQTSALTGKYEQQKAEETTIAKRNSAAQYSYYLQQAETLTGLARYSEAFAAVTKAADTGTKLDTRYYFVRGQIYDVKGDAENAKADYQTAKDKLSITPTENKIPASALDELIGDL